jgi:hypothetical protein
MHDRVRYCAVQSYYTQPSARNDVTNHSTNQMSIHLPTGKLTFAFAAVRANCEPVLQHAHSPCMPLYSCKSAVEALASPEVYVVSLAVMSVVTPTSRLEATATKPKRCPVFPPHISSSHNGCDCALQSAYRQGFNIAGVLHFFWHFFDRSERGGG